jgi:hypothetical protein
MVALSPSFRDIYRDNGTSRHTHRKSGSSPSAVTRTQNIFLGRVFEAPAQEQQHVVVEVLADIWDFHLCLYTMWL